MLPASRHANQTKDANGGRIMQFLLRARRIRAVRSLSPDLRRNIAADVIEALRDPGLAKRLFDAGLVVAAEGPKEATRRLADVLE